MNEGAVALARLKMRRAGVDPTAIAVFSHHVRRLAQGDTGMIAESAIAPHEMPALTDLTTSAAAGRAALGRTVMIKLNGGLGTSMGLDRAKSLIEAREGHSFLDLIVRQVLAARRVHDVRLPLVLMNSFRTRADSLEVLADRPGLEQDLPYDFLQNKEPKLRVDDLAPVSWPADPQLEWCPPGHGDLYPALHGSGLLDAMTEAGYTQVFVSNSDNLGATPDPQVAGWFARSGAPFAIEAVRRTVSDRKGGHFARRLSDGRVILRETAQTAPDDLAALVDLTRHRYSSTNNVWFDIEAMRRQLEQHDGVLDLPLIRNDKTVDPSDPTSPDVVQIETAMGAAIELFADAATIEVPRARFVPVKTTDDLLVLRSDLYHLDDNAVLCPVRDTIPLVQLGPAYKLIQAFEQHFAEGVPSLRDAERFVVNGAWSFGADVSVRGAVTLRRHGGHVAAGSTLASAVD